MVSKTSRLACGVVAVLVFALSLAPAARAAGRAVPPPTPPTGYAKTGTCVSADEAGPTVVNGVSWAQTQLDFRSVWDLGKRGAGQRVAVIDTGVNPVPALADRVAGGGDYVVQGGTGLRDCDGHGTVVAGIIAASPDATSGFAGVAPLAQLMSIRQNSSRYGDKDAQPGSADTVAGTTASLAAAIRYAVYAGAKIINISAASCRSANAPPDTGAVAVQDAVDDAVSNDVVVIAAAGNVDPATACKAQNLPGHRPRTIATPADVAGVLTVAAVDRSGQPARFSLNGSWVDVAAPGVDLIATDPVAGSTGQVNQLTGQAGVSPLQGTSFAAPYVTGLAALVRARFPGLSAPKVIERIEATADHPAAPGGHNESVGFGMVDPRAALTAVLPAEDGAPPAPRSGPSVLPAAQPAPNQDRRTRLVSLIGSLGLLVVAATGAIVASTRRRRHDTLARRSAATAGGGRRW